MSPNIEKLIEDAKFSLAKTLDEQLYLPIKEELRRADVTHSLGQKKEMFKNRMEVILDNLKIELVRGIVEEEGVQAKNQYQVVYCKINSSKIELQEDDIPIGYQAYRSMFSSGSSSGTGAGGQEIVREVIVLRPVLLNVPMKLVEEKS